MWLLSYVSPEHFAKKLEAISDVKKMPDSKDPEDMQNTEDKATAAKTWASWTKR